MMVMVPQYPEAGGPPHKMGVISGTVDEICQPSDCVNPVASMTGLIHCDDGVPLVTSLLDFNESI